MQTTADQDPVVDSTIPGTRNAPRSQTIKHSIAEPPPDEGEDQSDVETIKSAY